MYLYAAFYANDTANAYMAFVTSCCHIYFVKRNLLVSFSEADGSSEVYSSFLGCH